MTAPNQVCRGLRLGITSKKQVKLAQILLLNRANLSESNHFAEGFVNSTRTTQPTMIRTLKRGWPFALPAICLLSTSTAQAADTSTIDTGDTAWMLVSTALVLFMMIPGLALFYAGLLFIPASQTATYGLFLLALFVLAHAARGQLRDHQAPPLHRGVDLHPFGGQVEPDGLHAGRRGSGNGRRAIGGRRLAALDPLGVGDAHDELRASAIHVLICSRLRPEPLSSTGSGPPCSAKLCETWRMARSMLMR